MSSILSNDQIQRFTEALLACNSMQHPQKRGMIVSQLPKEIRTTIDRGNSAKDDVWAMVRRCAQFPQYGIPELIAAVRFHDRGTRGFKEVERLWSVFQEDIDVDMPDKRLEKSVADVKEVRSGEQSSRLSDADISQQARDDSPGRVEKTQSGPNAKNDGAHPEIWEKVAAFSFGVVFLLMMIVIAIFIPDPRPHQIFIFRVSMSLAAAGVGAVIPGLIQLEVNQKFMPFVRAGGAIALFVLVYLFNPGKV